jgi:hypothetical protein
MLRDGLAAQNLIVVVGAGVTIFSTMEKSGPLPYMTWPGLVRDGLHHYSNHIEKEDATAAKAKAPQVEVAHGLVNEGKIPTAAGVLTGLLKEEGQWPAWLQTTFAGLEKKVQRPEILDALKKFHQRGATLVTTNYDGLLEYWCGIEAVDISEIDKLRAWEVSSGRGGVFHPHGYFQKPDTVVLDEEQYKTVKTNTDIQHTLQAFFSTRVSLAPILTPFISVSM